MLLSGPAGGLQAAKHVGQQMACTKLLTLDMGGTSTDVALIDKDFKLSSESSIANMPVAIPMIEMHTIGAGGGSIARVDEGGLLQERQAASKPNKRNSAETNAKLAEWKSGNAPVLFDLSKDVAESIDVSAQYPEKVIEMKALAEKRLADIQKNILPLVE